MLLVYLLILLVVAALVAPLIPQRRRARAGWDGIPFVTLGLILTNLLVFLFTVEKNDLGLLSAHIDPGVARHFGIIPHAATLVTLFTHIFLHAGWEHLFGNMLFLWLFGPHVEEALGRLEYLLFYLGGGITAGLMHVLIAVTVLNAAADAPLVGASGAIAAVIGLYAVRFWRAKMRVLLLFSVPSVWALGVFGLFALWSGVRSLADGGASDGTANWAHVGGFLFGALIAVPLRVKDDSRREYTLEDADKAAAGNDPEKAAELYRKYLAENPADAHAHRSLARACVRLRQGETAHAHFMESLRLSLSQPASPANTAAVAGVYADACTAFAQFPLPPALLSRIAGACEETGNYNLAVRALSDLCRDHPDAKEAETGLLRLGKLHLQRLNQAGTAGAIFGEFLRLYPESEWRGHVERLWAEAERKGGR